MLDCDRVMDSSHWKNYQKFWMERKRHFSKSWMLELSKIQTYDIYTCICWHIYLSIQRRQYEIWNVEKVPVTLLCCYL